MKIKLLHWIVILLPVLQVAAGDAFEIKGHGLPVTHPQHKKEVHDFATNIELTMNDASGRGSVYRMRLGVIEEKNGVEKKLFIVEAPRHLKGTSLLIHSYEDRQDEQWLYLSARRRVKRIHPCFQAIKFLNSEWTYEDMGGQHSEKYINQWVRDDTIEGKSYSLFESVPKNNPHSGYLRQLRWIEKDTEYVFKIEYYDRKNELLKTLTIDRYQQYLDKDRQIKEINMVNNKTGKKMVITFSKYRTDIRLDKNNFDVSCFYKTKLRTFTAGTNKPIQKVEIEAISSRFQKNTGYSSYRCLGYGW